LDIVEVVDMKTEIWISKGDDGRITVTLPYNPTYISKVKTIKGYRWHPENKYWSFPSDDDTLKKILLLFRGKKIRLDRSLQPLDEFEKYTNVNNDLLTIKQASEWATDHIGKRVTPSNISYLIQYGRIRKINNNGNTLIDKHNLS